MALRQGACFAAAVASLACALLAHVRLIHSGNGNPLYWSDPAHVEVTIQSRGSDDIQDGSHRSAIRNSIDAWNRSTGTRARLVEDTSAASRARTDWASDDLHLVWFDETGASGFFPAGSGTVAVTPVWFTEGGRITDSDVLFNGRGFHFTTRGQSGAFDVEDVATHELGHLLGLDHSGAAGSSLFPYVSYGQVVHRAISSDDEHGLRHAYPSGPAGSIGGTVVRAGNSAPVAGALVVARSSAGRTVASVLASSSGTFQLRGLAPDVYLVYATPLDFPVSKANLTPGHQVKTNFRSSEHGSVAVAAGAHVSLGDLLVGADVALSLGRNYDPLPLPAVRGRTSVLALHGTGLDAGSTLACSDPALTIAPLSWMGSQVVFSAAVPAGAAPGHVDLTVRNALGDVSILPGAIEIVPAPPLISGVVPDRSTDAGGTLVTVTGLNFQSGLRLVVGNRIYRDGAPGGCTVVSASTVEFTAAPTPGGVYDVVAIDSSGVEGRAAGGFTFQTVPGIDSLFPAAGASAGGTQVALRGSGFAAGAAVRIDGVDQPGATVIDATRIRFATEPGTPGGPWVVEVENPGGAVATAAFAYVAQADPQLDSLDPASAPEEGLVFATLTGSGFTPATEVHFGAGPGDGQGGLAGDVTFVDAQTLRVLVPAHAPGVVSVMVSEPSTGQAQVAPASFAYEESAGGACTFQGSARGGARGALEGSGWILAAWLGMFAAGRRRARPRAC